MGEGGRSQGRRRDGKQDGHCLTLSIDARVSFQPMPTCKPLLTSTTSINPINKDKERQTWNKRGEADETAEL